ncbi:MAG: CHAD domain-containing protein, partial [Thaumarchaeota archaeon]|nr:CHAD domain-containing protein [Nitrososphaerota archaeon]
MSNKMKDSLRINRKIFLKKLEKISDNFYQELDRYIVNSNDENIHDIRVAIRRLESAYRVLPKKIRKQENIKYYLKQIKTLFKNNSTIRDYDIICTNIEAKYLSETVETVSLLKSLRSRQLKNAKQLVLEIS